MGRTSEERSEVEAGLGEHDVLRKESAALRREQEEEAEEVAADPELIEMRKTSAANEALRRAFSRAIDDIS